LLQKYSGPYVIKRVLDSDRFVITDLPGATRSLKPYEGVISVEKMKPYDMADVSDVESSSSSDGRE
jgi:hypothetical protein